MKSQYPPPPELTPAQIEQTRRAVEETVAQGWREQDPDVVRRMMAERRQALEQMLAYTIREYCRVGRIRAKKKLCGRGKGGKWIISHEELTRLRNEGPLPLHGPD